MIEQEHAVLYRNSVGVFYSTTMSPTRIYPFENLIKVYHDLNGNVLSLEDDYANRYRIVNTDELYTYTWRGVPVVVNAEVATTAHFGEILIPQTSRETHVDYTVLPIVSPITEPIDRSFARFHLDEEPKPRHRPELLGSIVPSPPPRLERTRGKWDEANKALRPSTLQKFCKKSDGTGDHPYDHIAQISTTFVCRRYH